jgi:CRP-like cAMP-binding protein
MSPFRDQRLVEAIIGKLKLFWAASPEQRARLAAQSWTAPLARGGVLARRGERLPGVIGVAYGALKLRLPVNGSKERVLRVVGAGESFGESAALLGRALPYEPVALAGAKLVVVPTAAVFEAIERDPRTARGIVAALAERNLQLVEEIEVSAARRGVQRLAAYLDSVAEPAPTGLFSAQLPGTKTLVAARLGMSKETLSRLLRSLAAQGLLQVSHREIAIVDRAALARLASAPD